MKSLKKERKKAAKSTVPTLTAKSHQTIYKFTFLEHIKLQKSQGNQFTSNWMKGTFKKRWDTSICLIWEKGHGMSYKQHKKNSVKIFNKVLKSKCEIVWEYRVSGTQRHRVNSNPLILFSLRTTSDAYAQHWKCGDESGECAGHGTKPGEWNNSSMGKAQRPTQIFLPHFPWGTKALGWWEEDRKNHSLQQWRPTADGGTVRWGRGL